MSSQAQLLLDSAVRDDDDPLQLYHHLNASLLEAAKDGLNTTVRDILTEVQTHSLFNDTFFGPGGAMESTPGRARAQVFILLGFAMVFNGWILFVADMDQEGQCDIKMEYVGMYQTMTIVETIVCMLVPSVLIIACNCLVVSKLNSHIKKNPGSPAVSFNTADVVLTTQTSAPSNTLKSYTRISSRFSIDVEKTPKKKKKGIRYTDIQLTRSLLVVTWAFILLNIPNYGYRIASILFGVPEQSSLMTAISLGAHVFLYTHHAFLFYLYIFYSPQMKRRLKPTAMKLLECYCFKPPGDYTDHT
uniref:G_PROTEIN_RECEP_F1_2 domain-containing protein n=1 Tax=Caenorhabditis tropicalis TaxID=1561998 RepID=A0A1I7T576_9PELO